MNESGSLDGHSIFTDPKNSSSKKVSDFEDTLNRVLLRSVYFNEMPTVMENEGWCSTGFLIENRCVLQQMHAISIQNRITFT